MTYILLSLAVLVLLLSLLYFEKRNQIVGKLLTKTPLSLLFVWLALDQQNEVGGYSTFIIVGLVLSLIGDVFLIFPKRQLFLSGLVSFLLGHVAYVFAFFSIAELHLIALLPASITIIISIVVFRWLKPHIASMFAPVLAYIIIITCMVIGAGVVFADSSITEITRWMIFIGAVLFFLSDLFVARNRFVVDQHINRLFGLPLYYSAQFILASTVGMI